MSVKLRLKYSKTGRAKYISHLDLAVTMHRALLRAETDLKYSEGFNPHPYISVALPLKVGDESVCELLDFAVAAGFMPPEGFLSALNKALPEGIKAHEIYPSARKFAQISWLSITGYLFYAQTNPRFADELKERFSADEIIISKKTKSGMSEINIAAHMKDIEFHAGDDGKTIKMNAKISAQNPSINPENIISSLNAQYEKLMPEFYTFTRTQLFDVDFSPFY